MQWRWRKSPQKRPLWSRRGSRRFRKTGWWCAQSDTNPSPCYLPNIRVIFEKNSEPAGENSKNPCSTGISRTWRQFDIREEQGAPNFHNSERAFNELGRRRWVAGRLGATTQGRALAGRVCFGVAVVSGPARRPGRCAVAGSRLGTRGLEGAAHSAKDDRTRRLNRYPHRKSNGEVCKPLNQLEYFNSLVRLRTNFSI